MNRYAILTGNLQLPEADSGNLTGSIEIDYPEGFTKDNCCIVSLLSHSATKTDYWSTQTNALDSLTIILGNACCVTLKPEKIRIAANKVNDSQPTNTITYKLVLMKIS